MIAPRIHLNGTSKSEILEQLRTAGRKLQAAANALSDAAPNARDYYVIGADAFQRATIEHASRSRRLREVFDELQEIAMDVSDQGRD